MSQIWRFWEKERVAAEVGIALEKRRRAPQRREATQSARRIPPRCVGCALHGYGVSILLYLLWPHTLLHNLRYTNAS